MIELTKENIESEIRAKHVLIVDFGAEWCGPCQDLSKVFGNIDAEINEAEFATVDLAQDETLATIYNIKNFPTVIVYKNGSEIQRFEGFVSEADLKTKLKSVL